MLLDCCCIFFQEEAEDDYQKKMSNKKDKAVNVVSFVPHVVEVRKPTAAVTMKLCRPRQRR